jgi:hypothetical protein
MKTSVHHWRFEDGTTSPNAGHPIKELILDPPPRGWYCWVYPKDDRAFEEWMTRICPTADMCHRFNSGDPVWTVYIKDDVEATVFQLMWM